MDKKFLNKVLEQIVSETRVDYDYMNGRIFLPYLNGFILFDLFPIAFPSYHTHFTEHCKNIYGLNKEEIDYVWDEYNHIIKDNIDG